MAGLALPQPGGEGAAMAMEPVPGRVFRDCHDCPEMVVISAGQVRRGDGAALDLAQPLAVGRFAVTFDEWNACILAKACQGGQDDHGWGKGRRPVINVSWDQAKDYTRWLSSVTGAEYDLPTEAEFEYAARGGTGTAYWWGDEAGFDNANCRQCNGRWGGKMTAPVGSFPPNPFGLYDMNGNVWTWTDDCWSPPAGRTDCRDRVIRGGSWYYFPNMAQASARARNDDRQWSYNIGLRVIRRLVSGQAPLTPMDPHPPSTDAPLP